MATNHSQGSNSFSLVRFAYFEADFDSGQLRKRGVRMRIRPQSLEVLRYLIERPGQVVTREELQRQLWPGEVFVDFDKSLNTAVAQLRAVLHDSADRPRFIETLPRRGYRFVAEVQPVVVPASAAEPQAPRMRLLVLPFLNASGDPAQEYFADAMTDEIITALAGVLPEDLAVIARTTAMHYKGTRKDVGTIGREMNVDYLIEGGVVRWNEHLAVNVQLIQVSDQAHLFAKKYDAQMRDVFTLHNCVAQEIARHLPGLSRRLHDEVLPAGQVRRKPTDDIVAYNDCLKGRCEIWSFGPESAAKAQQYFEAALARDPEFALAYCGLAQLYWYIGFAGFAPSRQTDPVGRFYALRAIEIDPTLAEAHALLSYYPKQRQFNDPLSYYDWPASLKDVVRARELNPRSSIVQLRYAIILMILGRTEEAAAELERALESDPLSAEVRSWFVEVLCLARQPQRALEQALRLVELEPHTFMSHCVLSHAYLTMQCYDQGAAAARKAVELSGGLPLMLGWLGLPLGLGGQAAEARAVLERLRALAGQRYVPPTSFAWLHLGLGEIDEAFVWMDKAVDAPDRMMSPIKTYPFFDPIRSDPRFTALLRKMNLDA